MRTKIVILFALVGGCTTWNQARELPADPATPGGSGGGVGSSGGATGLPCDVDSLLGTYCRSCHGAIPVGGAPMSLESYADLMVRVTGFSAYFTRLSREVQRDLIARHSRDG